MLQKSLQKAAAVYIGFHHLLSVTLKRLKMKLNEWLALLTPERKQSSGEDLADSIGLIVVMALLCVVIFI